MPVGMWQHIAECRNFYMYEKLENRVDAYFEKKEKRDAKAKAAGLPVANTNTQSRRDVRQDFMSVKPTLPHEICVYIGLLCTRTIMPNREKLANHWRQDDVGAISRGIYGRFLARDRFMDISRNLHLNSNQDPRAKTDRAYKIRSVVIVLQETFVKSFVPPAELSFDEAMLPSRSSYNRIRMYMKDNPHNFEAYCGQTQHIAESGVVDIKSGPAAVVRNLPAVFGDKDPSNEMWLVVVDRFYTSNVLAEQLWIIGFNTIEIIMMNRRGFCKAVVSKKKKRPKNIPRGTLTFARSKLVNNMTAVCWWDSKPVHFLLVGGNFELDRVERREKTGELKAVPYPKIIKSYHQFMGGVDIHDQLRLQRYSVQRAITYRKYYKSLCLELVDLAITNGFTVHRAFCKKEIKPLTRVQYMCRLHLEPIALTAGDMFEANTFQPGHTPKQVDEWRDHSGQMQKNCEVCAMRTESKRGATTTSYFNDCDFAGPIYLCMKLKWSEDYTVMNCWEIWHTVYKNGKAIKAEMKGKFLVREPPRTAHSPKKPPFKRRHVESE
ncbi:hypothetical protein PHMEG_00011806 [Phytophthora megakarya]|uniref:PiggyBac transposable element-derived protein domain-containing protein n=1 Tax=Phytophthora megakarya TaxID=4795 RepID=A0A225WAC1_9STRA|nr:hypothetical protein PHMEG_00011806 [Phytophthora megakarya]